MEPVNRPEMKRLARESMRTHRPSVYLVTLVLIVILYVLEMLLTRLELAGVPLEQFMAVETEAQLRIILEQMQTGSSFPGHLLILAITVISLVIHAGYTDYCLRVSRGQEAGYGTLFDTFGIFFKVIWLRILTSVFVMLWSMLLIIPGIIASYRYSLALYLLLDDPDKSVMQCIQESKELTGGRKMELFLLDLSFLGWNLLCIIPFAVIYVSPYIGITKANFYREISGRWDAPMHFDVVI